MAGREHETAMPAADDWEKAELLGTEVWNGGPSRPDPEGVKVGAFLGWGWVWGWMW